MFTGGRKAIFYRTGNMSVIKSRDVCQIILKTLSGVNSQLMQHGEKVGYLLYKLLQEDGSFIGPELSDYVMLGILHDIGLYKEKVPADLFEIEAEDAGSHALYGYLFARHLSPLGAKAEIIKYHHLDFSRYGTLNLPGQEKKVLEFLSFADKMDYMLQGRLSQDYFIINRDYTISGHAYDCFRRLEEREHITEKLRSGSYRQELNELWVRYPLSEEEKNRFLEMLAFIIDFRSETTVIHTMTAVNFAEQLGILMNVSNEDLENIRYGALLHDLGKITIPPEILESSRTLSSQEMEIMRSHVSRTEAILKDSIGDPILQIAVRHHEKLDGSGYPRGLKDQEMTLPQKIVAVADILSALYGKRSYKEPFDKKKIKSIIRYEAESGKISKLVVQCLLDHYDQVIREYEKEKDNIIGLYLNIKSDYQDICGEFGRVV